MSGDQAESFDSILPQSGKRSIGAAHQAQGPGSGAGEIRLPPLAYPTAARRLEGESQARISALHRRRPIIANKKKEKVCERDQSASASANRAQ